MATYVPAKKNTAYIFYASLVSQANTKINQANPTLAAGDFQVSGDGAALANLTTLPTVTPAAGRMVKFSLSAAEMNFDNVTVVCSDAAGAEWCDATFNIQTAARQIDDLAYPATSGRSMVVDAAGLVDANAVKVGPTGAGTAQTAGDIMADTNDIQTRLPAALVGGRMDVSVGAMAANVITAAATAADFGAEIATAIWTDTTAGDFTVALSIGKSVMNGVALGTGLTVNTVTNQLTAAAIATGVWQDAVAGDFTVASSIGKTLYIANIVPGAAGGLFISGSNAGTTTLGALVVSGTTTYTGVVTCSAGFVNTYPVGAYYPSNVVDSGTAQSATGTTLVLRAAAAFADSELIGATIVIRSATAGAGQRRVITAYTSATDTATVDTWTTTPTGTIVYDIFGTAQQAPTVLANVNVAQISGDSVAADNAESFFDGTGYAGTGNTIPTVTTLTNLPAITANWLTAAGTAADFGTEMATAIWTDTTAADFTVALSIGKSVLNGVALGTGLTINGYTGNTVQTGDSFARIGAAGAGLTNIDLPNQTMDITGNLSGSVGSVAAGGITAASIATGAIDADALATDAVTEIRSIVTGTADSGTTTTVVDAERTEADTDYWKDMAILFTSGTISGQARLITAFNAATDTITFSPATTQAVGTNTYSIITNVAAAGASAPTAAEVATAVWDRDATTNQTQGSFGQAIGDPGADTNTIYKAVVTDATGATVGVDVVAVKAETVTILADTDNLQTRVPAALVSGRMDASVGAMAADTITAAATAADAGTEIANAILDLANGVETGLTAREALRLITAALAGKLSGAATATNTIRNAVADTKNRITATVDADGNRTAITVDLT